MIWVTNYLHPVGYSDTAAAASATDVAAAYVAADRLRTEPYSYRLEAIWNDESVMENDRLGMSSAENNHEG